jgi:hypothetical protein
LKRLTCSPDVVKLVSFLVFFPIGCLVQCISSAQAPTAVPHTGPVPLPEGPFSSWPADLKGRAVASLTFRCNLVSGMALGNYHGPLAAAKEYAQALTAACVDGQMPDDWPGHVEIRDSLLRHFDAAHQQDPTLPMPQWPRSGPPPPYADAYRSNQRWNARPSSSTDAVTFSLAAIPYHTAPKNTDCCKPMALPDHEDEKSQVRYRIPRNYLVWMDDWNGGAQTLVKLKVTFPGFEPLTRATATCLSLSAAFRPTTCTPVEFVLRNGGTYEPPDEVRFNNVRDLFHSQDPLPGPYGFELYETGPPEARINTYRKVTPQHTLVIFCFLHSSDQPMAVCNSVSRLESGVALSYFLYSDQLKDAEQIDTGIRQLIRSFQLEGN